MNRYGLIFAAALLILLTACARKPLKEIDRKIPKNVVIENIYKKNPLMCRIKSKGVFFYEDRFNKVKFKGTLLKTCDKKLEMNVLGMFSQIYAQAVYENGNLEIIKDEKDISDKYKHFFKKDQIRKLINILNIPLIRPDKDFDYEVFSGFYIFTGNDTVIYADPSYRIVRIRKNDMAINYSYNKGKLADFKYRDSRQTFSIKFREPVISGSAL